MSIDLSIRKLCAVLRVRALAGVLIGVAMAFAGATAVGARTDQPSGPPASRGEAPKAKVALLSTSFVLERKFQLMAEAAHRHGIELDWVQVDRADARRIAQALDRAQFLIIDAPRQDDQARIEASAGEAVRRQGMKGVSVNIMSPPVRMRPLASPAAEAQRVFDYYTLGMPVNRDRLFAYLRALIDGQSTASVPPPEPLPEGGIYHPANPRFVHATLPDYLAWWSSQRGESWRDRPVVGIEISPSFISDAQTRPIDTLIAEFERRGAVPIAFYRAMRGAEGAAAPGAGRGSAGSVAAPEAAPSSGGDALRARDTGERAAPRSFSRDPFGADGFPNPARRPSPPPEPLITLDGRTLPEVMLIYTFLGTDPDGRGAWLRSLDVPAVNVLAYRSGSIAEYRRDLAGVPMFFLPVFLTVAEYIGLIDPVVVAANEGGETTPMPEQVELLVGKVMNLVALRRTPNAEKRLALFYWNHPPGENNQGASHLNVPRSIVSLSTRLREAGYRTAPPEEAQVWAAVRAMQRPAYRRGALRELMQTPHWTFLPLSRYRAFFERLPTDVRDRITKFWGEPERSPWIARFGNELGFIVPRLSLGELVVLPQPWRGETAWGAHDEKKAFHDTQMPLSHHYLAVYLWVRDVHRSHAIIHLGTHGTQEWTPGKERGLWAYDDPNLLVGNTPVVYPYIVDNIGEAIHVKRRGRGVIVSHQVPALSPAGMAPEIKALADLIREYQQADEGPIREGSKKLIIDTVLKLNLHKDLKWEIASVERRFDHHLRALEDWLEDISSAQQPLGLHSLGVTMTPEHQTILLMQMLGEPLYRAFGIRDARKAFAVPYEALPTLAPYRFVREVVLSDRPLAEIEDLEQRKLAARGRDLARTLASEVELDAVVRALEGRWIDPSYGGDPLRNPDALPTGRNMYGFDPSRVPTRAAWEAGKKAVDALVEEYRAKHGRPPEKLAFTMWSTETMRHLGMLEAQVFYALGVRPRWDAGGRVVGMERMSLAELGRPRIDVVVSMTGLWRDQFPNVMMRMNEAIALVESAEEPAADNPVRTNTRRIEAALVARGVEVREAREFALTRLFGNQSGDYGTGLPEATLASDQWQEGDGALERLYLARMSWAYGPDSTRWSRKLSDSKGAEINVYAEQLRGTSAAVFSRSSNVRGLLDTDHPFEYLGGISMAVKHLDGKNPALFISNLRDPNRARLQTAENFLAMELRSVYHHPNWLKEMKTEGASGAQQLLNTINNFWGWQVMDRNIVRDDQWQEFKAIYVDDRYRLGLREWFEKTQPSALAQISERMLEAIRKGYWQADEKTIRDLARLWADISKRHDVQSLNEAFKSYVAEVLGGGAGYGLDRLAGAKPGSAETGARRPEAPTAAVEATAPPQTVRGQTLVEREQTQQLVQHFIWVNLLVLLAIILAGVIWQIRRYQGARAAFLARPPGSASA